MNEQNSRFETFKLATQFWHGDEQTSTLIIIIFILAFLTLLLGGFIAQNYLRKRNKKRYFVRYALSRDLTEDEITLLWEYANKMERDPILVLEFKAPFEKVVDLYIKEHPDADEAMIQDMRKKLDFIITSPYIPLVTTKDIELFQNGRMIFANNKGIGIALYDKDERFMYWLVVDGNLPSNVTPGTLVKIVFVRPDDGIYTLSLPIEEIIKEGGKTVVKLPHTFDFHRSQRREFPRIKVNELASVRFHDHKNNFYNFQATLYDISAGGAKLCFVKDDNLLKLIRFGDVVEFETRLNNKKFHLHLKILEKEEKSKELCIRGEYVDIKDKEREEIMEFVQQELLKLAQLKSQS